MAIASALFDAIEPAPLIMKKIRDETTLFRLVGMADEAAEQEGRAQGFRDPWTVDAAFGLYQQILLVASKFMEFPKSHSMSRLMVARESLDERTNSVYWRSRGYWKIIVDRAGGPSAMTVEQREASRVRLEELSEELDLIVESFPPHMRDELFSRFAYIESQWGTSRSDGELKDREHRLQELRDLESEELAIEPTDLEEDVDEAIDADIPEIGEEHLVKDDGGDGYGPYEPEIWDEEYANQTSADSDEMWLD